MSMHAKSIGVRLPRKMIVVKAIADGRLRHPRTYHCLTEIDTIGTTCLDRAGASVATSTRLPPPRRVK